MIDVLIQRVRSRGLEDVVILNVDTNTIESPFEDLKKIPADVVSGLKLCLKRQAASAGVGVAKAFLRAQALLFGGYGDALKGNTVRTIIFWNTLGTQNNNTLEYSGNTVRTIIL
uniref:Uncharacterized protein n=1 Tax=Hucho hucho TaxID=62062 RepID=A0A4W5LM53_9TELE